MEDAREFISRHGPARLIWCVAGQFTAVTTSHPGIPLKMTISEVAQLSDLSGLDDYETCLEHLEGLFRTKIDAVNEVCSPLSHLDRLLGL